MDDAVVADTSHRNSRSAAAADHRRHRCFRRQEVRFFIRYSLFTCISL